MNSFFIGLQFLTRLQVVKQTQWTSESFGKSVKYFTLIGFVLGMLFMGIAYSIYFLLPSLGICLPKHFSALIIIVAGILLTGGLHCDGFMDTMDGIFSGRSRERMLEIMKDSHVGANGVFGFAILILAKWSLLIDQSPEKLLIAIFLMPILGRLAMVMSITLFPYARPEGIGKAFAEYATKKSFYFAFAIALFCTLYATLQYGTLAFIAFFSVLLFTYWFSGYVTKTLGGLTGDVYGAVTEISETIVLFVFLF